jgi:hypothetical protein
LSAPNEATQIHGSDLVCCLRLGIEHRGQLQLDASQRKELPLEVPNEYLIPVIDNGARNDLKLHNGLEEDTSDSEGWPNGKKNHCLGEPVDNGEDDVFVVDAQETFNEIHGHISPKCDWYLWWL